MTYPEEEKEAQEEDIKSQEFFKHSEDKFFLVLNLPVNTELIEGKEYFKFPAITEESIMNAEILTAGKDFIIAELGEVENGK